MKKSVPHLIRDEEQAIKDYGDSATPKTRKVFKHIKGEEQHHKKELVEVKKDIAKKMK